ncbi:beta-N-acetylhexosaminidase isoform X3 [Tachysurus vachellii]|uniref:beta-N-acetylhexosaminidase isoform X3 n=1 Tax=Tachysurus vachellii TaxID=175792 RepID=UPI00296B0B25|nr:beta-N-acetylhexosaminidase isoform X3 [Tachysurus vachellii]
MINRVMDYKTLIRLLIGCLAVFGAARLYFSQIPESGVFARKTMHISSPGKFWQTDGIGEPTMLDVNPSLQTIMKKPKNYKNVKNPKLRVLGSLKAKARLHTGPLNVVHLDLKGAAPKVTYFQKLFPLISSLGANGILMEYEDMFPYEGKLGILRSSYSYSEDDIEEIKSLANLYNLELIPLVQVFGHLEFVLKHGQFFDLREVYDFPNSLNPSHPESLQLIEEMLTQVLMKHPQTKWFHIGADEVYGLGESKDSKKWMKQNNRSEGNLFLSHVTKVCQFLTELSPGIKPIFWEDMLRKLGPNLIIESGLPSIASPVIWNYGAEINLSQIGQLLSNYQKAGFQNVWFASAFKGASGVDQRWTPLNLHLQNHLAWIKVMASMSKYPSLKLDGIALTGWQREPVPISAVIGHQGRIHPGRSANPSQGTHTLSFTHAITHYGQFSRDANQPTYGLSFDQGRKPEYPEETPKTRGEHANSTHTRRRRESNPQPWRCEANVLTTKPPCPPLLFHFTLKLKLCLQFCIASIINVII